VWCSASLACRIGDRQADIVPNVMQEGGQTMSVEENKAVARRWYEEVVAQGNLALIDELFAPDFMSHNPQTRAAGIMDPFVKTLGRGNLRWRHLLSPADWQGCVHR